MSLSFLTPWLLYQDEAENGTNTEVKVDKVNYAWTINNFDYCEEIGIDICSPTFAASTSPKITWGIKLAPKFEPEKADVKSEYISLHLCLNESTEQETVFARFSFHIFDEEEKIFLSRKSQGFRKFVTGANSNSWGFERFCIKDEKFREQVLSNNILRIHCEVTFPRKADIFDHNHYCNSLFFEASMAERHSTNIWDTLLKTHLLSDVIISVKSKEFPAHKAILAARSKVFAAMFQHDMKENQQNRIEIEDMSEEAVDEMLHFIYMGKCSEKLNDLATELYAAAEKYDMNLLRLFCLKSILKNLSVKNAAQNLLLAESYEATEFKSEIIKFIIANAKKVFVTKDWKKILNNPRLSQEVFVAMTRQGDSDDDIDVDDDEDDDNDDE